jgi:ketosteroid isomerase-like protein
VTEESTTHDLVELARRYVEAGNRRDFDAMMGFWAPNGVQIAPGGYTFEGRAAIRGLFEDLAGSFDDLHGETEEFIDFGHVVAFSVTIIMGHPVGSSGELRVRFAAVGVWTEGVIERATDYTDIDEARAASERLAEERG